MNFNDCLENLLPPVSPMKISSGVDRYGFSNILASSCCLHMIPRSFANWVHGWVWHEEPNPELLACSKLPRDLVIVVRNEIEEKALHNDGFKDVRIGGLPFAYVNHQHDLRFDDMLLAIPAHSSESKKMTADQQDYLNYLESLKNDFERVYVSIFYLDVGGAMHEAALGRGLHVIQGARPDDANSLLRMRAIFDAFEYVTSNVMGSHMLYSLFSGCCFSFCGPLYSYDESVILGVNNPLGHSSDYARLLLDIQSEPYLRKRFGRFYVDNPRNGIKDSSFAEEAIGVKRLMHIDEIKDALGWSIAGQVRGYSKGAYRRFKRLIGINI
jgi:hypothetical protein